MSNDSSYISTTRTTKKIVDQDIWASLLKLDRWIERNGWAGYDPYDIKGTPLFIYLLALTHKAPLPLRAIRSMLTYTESRVPWMLRRLFGIKKQINAKAMGLFAKSFLNLYAITKEKRFKQKALDCLSWLENNVSQKFSGFCWGYPFDWQSHILIPRGTPSAVVSSTVGDAYWSAYRIIGNSRYLDVCINICEFFIKDLKIDDIDADCICFSYTPLDNFHVHNANLFVAEFLTRVGKELKRDEFLEFGRRSANYALREQNPDGSLFYWGNVQNRLNPNHIDHYHSGFEMRMLKRLWRTTEDQRYGDALERYYRFYLKNLIIQKNGEVIPKYSPDQVYPVNIHCCAEAILCNTALSDEFEQPFKLLPGLCRWTLNKMQTKAGWFRYMILNTPLGEYSVDIPYVRWGQAWMLLALSSYIKTNCDIRGRETE